MGVPSAEISYWPDTLERWRREGLPAEADPLDYFGRDRIGHIRFDCSLQLPERAIAETADCRIAVDANGVTTKTWLKHYAPPAQLDFTITGRDAWRAHRERLRADLSRIRESAWQVYRDCRARGGYIYHSDHSIPPTVSFDSYRRVIELVREYGSYEG